MARIFEDNSRSIGGTPLIRLNHLTKGLKGTVLVKVEGRNPSYSVKCRIGASMIWDAEERGILKPGVEIIEPTSGNTGIALAYVAAARGYKLTLTMPETMSIERRRVLAALGANIILTLDLSIVDRVEQVTGDEAIEFAKRLSSEEGILVGISAGAATAAAVRLAALDEFAGRTIVVILPDTAERYLSTSLFEGV